MPTSGSEQRLIRLGEDEREQLLNRAKWHEGHGLPDTAAILRSLADRYEDGITEEEAMDGAAAIDARAAWWDSEQQATGELLRPIAAKLRSLSQSTSEGEG